MATEYVILPDGTLSRRIVTETNLGVFADLVAKNLTLPPVFIPNAFELDSFVATPDGDLPAKIPVSILGQNNNRTWLVFIPKDSVKFTMRLHLRENEQGIFSARGRDDLRPGNENIPGTIICNNIRWRMPFEDRVTLFNVVEIGTKVNSSGRTLYSAFGETFRMSMLFFCHSTRKFYSPYFPNVHDNGNCCTGEAHPVIAVAPSRPSLVDAARLMHDWFEENKSNDHLVGDQVFQLFSAKVRPNGSLEWIPPYPSSADALKNNFARLGRETGTVYTIPFSDPSRNLPQPDWVAIRAAAMMKKNKATDKAAIT